MVVTMKKMLEQAVAILSYLTQQSVNLKFIITHFRLPVREVSQHYSNNFEAKPVILFRKGITGLHIVQDRNYLITLWFQYKAHIVSSLMGKGNTQNL